MAKAFSLASWNVEHFKDDPSRVGRIVEFIREKAKNPDVFALYEVEGKEVYGELVKRMPGYTFHITEGAQVQEILVGVKGSITAFFTQRTEFKAGNAAMRPGALLSLHVNGVDYTLLFLHTASKSDPRGFGLRDDMLVRACDFRKTLDKAVGEKGKSRYLFIGDLNVMGLKYPFDKNIPPDIEVKKLEKQAKRVGMSRLLKDGPTWSNGSSSTLPDGELDQIVASGNLTFKPFNGYPVKRLGWAEVENDPAQKDAWIKDYSDHCMLYLEVQA